MYKRQLLRPGRFDRQIVVDRPDIIGREKILEVHARGKPLDKDVMLKTIARQTPGFTGADIANLFNESALLAARPVSYTHLDVYKRQSLYWKIENKTVNFS